MSLDALHWPDMVRRSWLGRLHALWPREYTVITTPAIPVPPAMPIRRQRTETRIPASTLPTTGTALRRLRLARGLTQEDVSALTKALPGNRGISATSVSAVELWKSNLEPATVESYLLAMEQWGA